MKSILIGYDGSPCAEAAVEELDRAGLPDDLKVSLLSVADVWLPPDPAKLEPAFPDPVPKSARAAREQALKAVESARVMATGVADRLRRRHPGWKVEALACADSPAWALVQRAAVVHADLIVVGSHGRGPVERFFLGSVSQRVLTEAPCAVRIVRIPRHRGPAPLRLLVAVDGSKQSVQLVEWVVARSWPAEAEVRLATVIDPRMESSLAWSTEFARDWVREHDQGIREGVCRMIEKLSTRLAEAGLRVETGIYEGDARRELLRVAEAWEAEAIFLGSHGPRSGFRPVLGATAAGVAAWAHCTVEVLRST